jgi:N-acylneuraminate cytidylyltransferase
VAIIPARGGSKGIPGKNLKLIGGIPLIARAIQSCKRVADITDVYVTTDDSAIAEVAERYGAKVIHRPAELATDNASSESALLHALENISPKPSTTVFIQATSPFIPVDELRNAVEKVETKKFDVVFSAIETYGFLWRRNGELAEGVNHDASFRPRRQDREPHYLETGAFYVLNTAGFESAKFRFFGKVGIEVVPESSAIEIDNREQLALAQSMAESVQVDATPLHAKALVMDFDGVHTDDHAYVTADGVESVRVSRSDGLGVSRLRDINFPMLILSKETNPIVTTRGNKLGIETIQGIDDKLPVLKDWAAKKGLNLADIAYIGNDVNDLPCLEAVGYPVSPADGRPEVKAIATIVTTRKGGRGAIREIADRILAGLKQ